MLAVVSHAPTGYDCPFCRNISDGTSKYPLEIIYRDADVFVKMNPNWWPNNPGNVLVIPTTHYENLFELSTSVVPAIHRAAWASAVAMKRAYRCDGISTRQHNEPAGNQDVWHFHLHVFPRWNGDDLYRTEGAPASAGELRDRAAQLRQHWPDPTEAP
ncbi:MAG: HIT family protein [Ilumatobacteraceae bacterium]|nr:HIT family protein [Ilumatobacteraceae bacterium]